jgi:hypothetical protein
MQEGHYIDERIQMSFTTPIDRLAEIIRKPQGYAGVEVELDTIPAIYTVIANLRVVEIKCKMTLVLSKYRVLFQGYHDCQAGRLSIEYSHRYQVLRGLYGVGRRQMPTEY